MMTKGIEWLKEESKAIKLNRETLNKILTDYFDSRALSDVDVEDIIDYHKFDDETLLELALGVVGLVYGTSGRKIVDILESFDQLDEVETLSQEWIDEHVTTTPLASPMVKWVSSNKLQNLLVPKQEELVSKADKLKPVVPQFVADWLEAYRDGWELYISIEEAINYDRFDGRTKESDAQSEEMQHWLLNADNQELYARAWLAYPNIEVDKEQRYRVEEDSHPILKAFDEKVKEYESYGSTSMRMAEVRKVLVEALEEEEE